MTARIAATVFQCADCNAVLAVRPTGPFGLGSGWDGDWFMVKDRVWSASQRKEPCRFLCVACLEHRIGRKLGGRFPAQREGEFQREKIRSPAPSYARPATGQAFSGNNIHPVAQRSIDAPTAPAISAPTNQPSRSSGLVCPQGPGFTFSRPAAAGIRDAGVLGGLPGRSR
jgi:hypothetical protein